MSVMPVTSLALGDGLGAPSFRRCLTLALSCLTEDRLARQIGRCCRQSSSAEQSLHAREGHLRHRLATADQIAQKVGIPRDSSNRAKAGIDHVLLEATSDGHCALPLAKLNLMAVKPLQVGESPVEQALSQMLTSGSLLLEEIDHEPLIFLPHLRRAEEGIALKIKRLAGGTTAHPHIDFDRAVAWCERRTGKTLAPSQREALKTVLGRITLVLVQGTATVPTLWSVFNTRDLARARDSLRQREGVFRTRADQFITYLRRGQNPPSEPDATIFAWAAGKNLEAAVWTNLPPKFDGIDGRVPTEDEVVACGQRHPEPAVTLD